MSESYRVAYRREGGPLLTRHYETYTSAVRKYRRIRSIEDAKLAGEFEGTSMELMEPLVELRLERRAVEPWEDNSHQPELTSYDAQAARGYAERLWDEKQDAQKRESASDGIVF